jgi:hypothetical protein
VVSTGLVLLVAEGLARLAANPLERPEPRDHGSLPAIHGLKALAQSDQDGVHAGVRHRTNSHGLRGPEYSEWPEDGAFRIAVTGDSIAMGWGVEEDAAYASLLEASLNAGAPLAGQSQSYEVLNFGLAGLNTRTAVSRLEHFSERYHPNLAIYGFTVNDIEGPHYRKSRTMTVARSWWPGTRP